MLVRSLDGGHGPRGEIESCDFVRNILFYVVMNRELNLIPISGFIINIHVLKDRIGHNQIFLSKIIAGKIEDC